MKVKLGDVCTIQSGGTPSRTKPDYWENGQIPWVKISDIKSKYVDKTEECITKLGLKNSSAKMFPSGTILYTIFATLGETCVLNIDATTNQAIAGIAIKDNNIISDYLYYYLLSRKNSVQTMGRGVAQNNINLKMLKDFEIPLPPLDEQRRIAAVLDKVSDLITKRREQLRKLDELVKARFVEMFGDPSANSHWSTHKLSELGELNRGISKHRPRNDPKLLGGPYPLIQTGDVSNSGLYIQNYSATYSEFGLAQSRLWKKGTLCITIAANIAQTSILAFDACFPDSVVGFLPGEKTNVVFVHYWFSFFQKILEEQAPQVAQKNINLKILSDLDVIVPPYHLQADFSNFVGQIENCKLTIQHSLDTIETLKKALMQEYFG